MADKKILLVEGKDNVILSRKPSTWDDFFTAFKEAEVPDDFLDADGRRQGV